MGKCCDGEKMSKIFALITFFCFPLFVQADNSKNENTQEAVESRLDAKENEIESRIDEKIIQAKESGRSTKNLENKKREMKQRIKRRREELKRKLAEKRQKARRSQAPDAHKPENVF